MRMKMSRKESISEGSSNNEKQKNSDFSEYIFVENLDFPEKTIDVSVPDNFNDDKSNNIKDSKVIVGDYDLISNENKCVLKIHMQGDVLRKVCFTGNYVTLPDGSSAFIERSKAGRNEIYTPLKLPTGSVMYIHADTLINAMTNESAVENVPVKREKSKLFSCNYDNCHKSYSSPHHLKIHTRFHTGDRPFKCSFLNCLKAFSTAFGLKTHRRTHNNDRPYNCLHGSCNKKFKTSGDLQKHIRIHTGEKPFLCPVTGCGRSFTTGNICKVHIRTHTGERPYSCTYSGCDKTFASLTNQRNHMRIHSGERPYMCSVTGCGKKFTEYSSLYKHNQVHRQIMFGCHYCSNKYRTSLSLKTHIRSTHGEIDEFLTSTKITELTDHLTSQVKLANDLSLDEVYSTLLNEYTCHQSFVI